MSRATFRGWTFTFDPATTRRAYETAKPVGPERCGCLYCCNFIAARDLAYPADVLELMKKVGIDPPSESEVWEYGPATDDPSLRLYGGLFHFAGEVLSSPENATENVQLVSARDLLPRPFGDISVVQVKFELLVPWVLAEPPTDSVSPK